MKQQTSVAAKYVNKVLSHPKFKMPRVGAEGSETPIPGALLLVSSDTRGSPLAINKPDLLKLLVMGFLQVLLLFSALYVVLRATRTFLWN